MGHSTIGWRLSFDQFIDLICADFDTLHTLANACVFLDWQVRLQFLQVIVCLH